MSKFSVIGSTPGSRQVPLKHFEMKEGAALRDLPYDYFYRDGLGLGAGLTVITKVEACRRAFAWQSTAVSFRSP